MKLNLKWPPLWSSNFQNVLRRKDWHPLFVHPGSPRSLVFFINEIIRITPSWMLIKRPVRATLLLHCCSIVRTAGLDTWSHSAASLGACADRSPLSWLMCLSDVSHSFIVSPIHRAPEEQSLMTAMGNGGCFTIMMNYLGFRSTEDEDCTELV